MGDGGLKDRKCVYEHNNNRMTRKPSRGSKKAVKRPHARNEIAPIKRGSSKKKMMTGIHGVLPGISGVIFKIRMCFYTYPSYGTARRGVVSCGRPMFGN